MDCPACQHANPADSRFCGGCGASLASEASCPGCGRPSAPEQRFCNGCGHPLVQAAALAPREPRAYTPRHLAEKILRSKSALEGERKQVTVLFADVKGSMDLAARLDPEEWHEILDRFFQILADGVHRFEGTVNQYTGDGIMALFGAPIAHEDHAQRACYAALHLTDALRDYAQELRREHGVDLSARLGLNSGEVVVGRIGDDLRMDYTAQGHTVGLAQRMEQLAEPGLPYASEHTAHLVEGYIDLTDLGEFKVKGSAGPVHVFGVAGVGPLRTRLERSRARGFSTFVGRSDELVVLDAALDQALDGKGAVVGVVGEAGVGKSRLCLEFVERCRARGIAVYEGHCVSYGVAMPLLPILEMIRGFLEITDADAPLRVREKVTGRLLTLDDSLREFLPLLFDLLGVPDPDDPPPPTDSAVRERQLFTFARRLIRARSSREPAVMLIDDTHWIDAGSDAVVAECVEVVPSTRTLFLLNFRPEYTAEWMSRSTYQQLPLRPLGDAAVTALLDELLGADGSLGTLRGTIRERTQGNPFYVEEVVRSLVDSGALAGERGGHRLVMPIDRIDVPSTVQGILAARIDRLHEDAKTVLQCAAAIGRTFSGELVRHVCELPDEAVTAALAALCRAELIYEQALYPEVEYAFRHPLTQEVAERSQLAAHRRRVHAALARVLEERAPGERGEHAALVAHHWDQAEEALPAALWHRRAAEWIGGANSAEATRHWLRVRTLADAIDDEGLAGELGERSRRLIIEYVWRRGLPQDEAEALLAEAEAWARRRNDMRALAGFYDAYGTAAALSHGQLARARQLIDEGRRLAQTAGDPALTFSLELRHAILSEYEGDVHKADAAARALLTFPAEDMEAASVLVGYDAPAFVRTLLGITAFEGGRLYEARIRVEDAARFATARGATEVAGWSLSVLADVLHTSGDVQAALRYARESMAIAEQLQSHLSVALAAVVLAEMLPGIGDLDGALAVGERALAATEKTFRPYLPRALGALAMIQVERGDVAEATTLAERAIRSADEIGLHDARIHAGVTLLQVEMAENEPGVLRTAPARLNRLRAECEELGQGAAVPRILTTLAEVYDRLGDERAATRTRRELEALRAEMLAPTPFDS